MIVRELLTRLGFEADNEGVKKYDGAMKDLGKSLAVVTGAAAASGAVMFGFMRSEAKAADESAKLGRQLGMTATQVEAMKFAEGQAGAEGFTDSLGQLSGRLAEAARGTGEAKTVLEDYGISATDASGNARSLMDFLPDLADSMQDMSREQQTDLANKLGLSPESILLLQNGSASLEELTGRFKELGGGIDQADAAQAEEFNDTMSEMGVVVSSIRRAVAVQFLPVAQELVETIREWFIANRDIIKLRMASAIEAISGALRVFWGFAKATMKTVNGLAKAMGGWENTLKILAVAIMAVFGVKAVMAVMSMVAAVRALSIAMWANPIGLIIAAVVALAAVIALIVEDIYHWVNGNDSAIGAVLGSWEDFKKSFFDLWESIKSYVMGVWDWLSGGFKGIVDDIKALWDWLTGGISSGMSAAVDSVLSVWDGLKNSIKAIIDGIIDIMPSWLLKGIEAGASWIGGAISKFTGGDEDGAKEIAGEASKSENAGNNTNNRMDVGQVSINVPKGTSGEQAQAVSGQVRQIMQREFAAANRNQTVAEG